MANLQNAVILSHKGADFSLGTRPIPQAGAGEVLVRIRAAALNPVDWKIPKWDFLVTEYPAVLGCDVAGDVIAVGEGVTKFSVGDRIFGSGLPHRSDFSAFQEYCKLMEDFSAKIPDALTYEQASTFPCAFLAAYQGLYNDAPHGMALTPLVPDGRGKYTGSAILVIGGGSSVGQFAIELAKGSGFSQIITTASVRNTERLKSLGATHIIDRKIPLDIIHAQLTDITGSGVKYIFDAISEPETQKAAFDLLSSGGRLTVVLPMHIPTDVEEKKVSLPLGFPDTPYNQICVKTMYSGIEALVVDGIVKPSNVEIVPGGLSAVAGGLQRLENNQVSGGKLVIRPFDD